jgi:hypothetical protein
MGRREEQIVGRRADKKRGSQRGLRVGFAQKIAPQASFDVPSGSFWAVALAHALNMMNPDPFRSQSGGGLHERAVLFSKSQFYISHQIQAEQQPVASDAGA